MFEGHKKSKERPKKKQFKQNQSNKRKEEKKEPKGYGGRRAMKKKGSDTWNQNNYVVLKIRMDERRSTALYCELYFVLGTILPRKTLNTIKINKTVNIHIK